MNIHAVCIFLNAAATIIYGDMWLDNGTWWSLTVMVIYAVTTMAAWAEMENYYDND